jgi:hypothetical protein
LPSGFHLDDARVLLGGVLPLTNHPQQLAAVEGHLVRLLVVREVREEHDVRAVGQRVRGGILRLLRFAVPHQRQLAGGVVESVAAFGRLIGLRRSRPSRKRCPSRSSSCVTSALS